MTANQFVTEWFLPCFAMVLMTGGAVGVLVALYKMAKDT